MEIASVRLYSLTNCAYCQAIIGFKVQEIKEAIGIRTEVDDLHDL